MKVHPCIHAFSAAVLSAALTLPASAQDAPPPAGPAGRHGMKHGMAAEGKGMAPMGGMMPPMMRRGGMMQGEGMMQGGGMHHERGHRGPRGGVPGEGDFQCWQEALGLTGEQLSSLKELYRAMRKEHILEQAKIAAAEVDLEGLLDADRPDLDRIEKILKESEGSRTRMRMGHFRAWGKALGVLTEEQRGMVEKLRLNLSPRHHGPCALPPDESGPAGGEGAAEEPPEGGMPGEHKM